MTKIIIPYTNLVTKQVISHYKYLFINAYNRKSKPLCVHAVSIWANGGLEN